VKRIRRSRSAYDVRLEPEQLDQLKLALVDELRPRPRRGPEFTEFGARFISWAVAERQKPSSITAKASILRLYLTPRLQAAVASATSTSTTCIELKQKLSPTVRRSTSPTSSACCAAC
jgi:hypothetical protein